MAGLPSKYFKAGIRRYPKNRRRAMKYAWSLYRSKGKRTRFKPRSKPIVKRRSRTMAKKKSGRRSFLSTATLMKFARLGALAAPAAAIALDAGLSTTTKLKKGVLWYTGFHMDQGTWNFWDALKGWGPFVGVSLLTLGVQKLMGMIRRV